MSFLTYANGRIETDSSTQLGELMYGMGELGKRKKKKKKGWFKKLMPHKLHMKLSPFGMLKKKKKKKKKSRRGGGGGDQQQEQSDVDTGAPPEGVVPAALQPPTTTPFVTTPGAMSPETYPMAPMYPSPMQPPMEYPSSQFPQAYPSADGGSQPYYEPQQQDPMPQFITTEEESKWQPPTPMYEGPSAYEADPGQRGMEIQQSGPSPFDTGESEFASAGFAPPQDAFGEGHLSGYMTSGGGSWEDQGWGGMAGEYDDQIQALLGQAQVLRGQGQVGAALALEDQARALDAMQKSMAEAKPVNWFLWGGIALGTFLLFGRK
jgi:hypothetical protein